jgi:hypothetical protein
MSKYRDKVMARGDQLHNVSHVCSLPSFHPDLADCPQCEAFIPGVMEDNPWDLMEDNPWDLPSTSRTRLLINWLLRR